MDKTRAEKQRYLKLLMAQEENKMLLYKPNPIQEKFHRSDAQFRFIRAGSQCLAKGTLVMTPKGPIKIEDIKIGDLVYDENKNPIEVLEVFNNGIKKVYDLGRYSKKYVTCTDEHVFLVDYFSREDGRLLTTKETKVKDFKSEMGVRRNRVKAPLGNIRFNESYLLGLVLGDGCCKESGFKFSTSSIEVVDKVRSILPESFLKKSKGNNYTWEIQKYNKLCLKYYEEWCHKKYAHEKIANIDEIRKWDRYSLLEFIAGLIDSDGSIYCYKDQLTITVSMQSKSIIDAIQYAFLALWQVPLSIGVDNRDKYKNGPVHIAYTHNSNYVREIMGELDSFIVSPQKKWKKEYEVVGGRRSRRDSESLVKLREYSADTYDIRVNSKTNLYMLANGLITHNSGKTFATTHDLAWTLCEKEVFRPVQQTTTKIAWMVAVNKGDVISILWSLYLSKFIPKRYIKKIYRSGGLIEHIEFTTGWKLYVKSYESGREALQGAPCDYILVDEMPSSDDIIDELEARVASTGGKIVYGFTPLKISNKIRRYFENPGNNIELFQMSRFDNPTVDKDSLISQMNSWDKNKINVRIYGEWANYAGSLIPAFNNYNIVKDFIIPEGWRKICSIDPATSSDTGVIWAAEDPNSGSWYVYRDLLVKELAPSDLVHKIIQDTHGDKIYLHYVDQAAAYLVAEARKFGVCLLGVNKKDNKESMVNEINQAFRDNKLFVFESCKNTIWEIREYTNNPSSSEFKPIKEDDHLVDALLYFYRGKPSFVNKTINSPLGDRILNSFSKPQGNQFGGI